MNRRDRALWLTRDPAHAEWADTLAEHLKEHADGDHDSEPDQQWRAEQAADQYERDIDRRNP